MKLSEAIREWKRNITTNMAVEYVLTLRADINAFSDAAQALESENAKLRKLVQDMRKAFFTLDIDHCQACPRDKASRRCQMFATTDGECAFVTEMRKLGIEVDE